ncbi:hypothetical protein CPB86DRAFT_820992 [Serendipita vermifera]|nr:hypothetical protein CPB86DRAFT_820992 [Serendipita vermifera]
MISPIFFDYAVPSKASLFEEENSSLAKEKGCLPSHDTPCSLNDFTSLKSLSLDLNTLCSSSSLSDAVSPFRPASILPPSLETFAVIHRVHSDTWRDEEYSDFLKRLLMGISFTCLPHLREITWVSNRDGLPSCLINLARERDVVIQVAPFDSIWDGWLFL